MKLRTRKNAGEAYHFNEWTLIFDWGNSPYGYPEKALGIGLIKLFEPKHEGAPSPYSGFIKTILFRWSVDIGIRVL